MIPRLRPLPIAISSDEWCGGVIGKAERCDSVGLCAILRVMSSENGAEEVGLGLFDCIIFLV